LAKRILLASTMPWAFAVAVERQIAKSNPHAQVDVANLFRLYTGESPHWRRSDAAAERINRKIDRFVVEAANGEEITDRIKLDWSAIPPVPQGVEGLRSYSLGAARVGLAVLSTATSVTTICAPASTAEFGAPFPRAWRAAHLAAQAGEQVAQLGYDEIWVFNGRFCYSRPFCDVVEAAGAKVFRYEQGSSGASFVAAHDSIHHPATAEQLILSHDFDRAAGESFYLDRLRKAPGDLVNFYTSGQVEGFLPDGVHDGEFVAFFNSSSDEFAAVSDLALFGNFANQFEAARAMARAAAAQGRQFVLRLHPHLRYKHGSWRREWDFDALRLLGAVVIHPDDQVDSYALAAAAHCVFTCGSTVGLECSFRGIPNADVGHWVGARLGAMHHVVDEADVARFIAAPALPENAREAALRYGSYVRRAGAPLPDLDPSNHPNYARIEGRIVDPLRFALQKMRDLGRRVSTPRGIVGGRIVLDPYLERRARKLKDRERN
jgi:hypothetical protein